MAIWGTTYSYQVRLSVTKEKLFNMVRGRDDEEKISLFVTAYRVSDNEII